MTYWNVEIEGELHLLEYVSKKAAKDYADNWWSELCEQNEIAHGEIMECDAELIEFDFDDNYEPTTLGRHEVTLSYEGYHGDHAEHFNQSSFV